MNPLEKEAEQKETSTKRYSRLAIKEVVFALEDNAAVLHRRRADDLIDPFQNGKLVSRFDDNLNARIPCGSTQPTQEANPTSIAY